MLSIKIVAYSHPLTSFVCPLIRNIPTEACLADHGMMGGRGMGIIRQDHGIAHTVAHPVIPNHSFIHQHMQLLHAT